jgi:hypothetical protein
MSWKNFYVIPINIDQGPHGTDTPVLTIGGEIEECDTVSGAQEAQYDMRAVHNYDASITLYKDEHDHLCLAGIDWFMSVELWAALTNRPSMLQGVVEDAIVHISNGHAITHQKAE